MESWYHIPWNPAWDPFYFGTLSYGMMVSYTVEKWYLMPWNIQERQSTSCDFHKGTEEGEIIYSRLSAIQDHHDFFHVIIEAS